MPIVRAAASSSVQASNADAGRPDTARPPKVLLAIGAVSGLTSRRGEWRGFGRLCGAMRGHARPRFPARDRGLLACESPQGSGMPSSARPPRAASRPRTRTLAGLTPNARRKCCLAIGAESGLTSRRGERRGFGRLCGAMRGHARPRSGPAASRRLRGRASPHAAPKCRRPTPAARGARRKPDPDRQPGSNPPPAPSRSHRTDTAARTRCSQCSRPRPCSTAALRQFGCASRLSTRGSQAATQRPQPVQRSSATCGSGGGARRGDGQAVGHCSKRRRRPRRARRPPSTRSPRPGRDGPRRRARRARPAGRRWSPRPSRRGGCAPSRRRPGASRPARTTSGSRRLARARGWPGGESSVDCAASGGDNAAMPL